MEASIRAVEKESAELASANRALAAKVAPLGDAHGREEVVKKTNQSVVRCVILRHVLKQLALESGVNWAADSSLRALFLAKEEQFDI